MLISKGWLHQGSGRGRDRPLTISDCGVSWLTSGSLES